MHDTSSYLIAISSLALLLFAALSAVDGIYIHLIRLKLHASAYALSSPHVVGTLAAPWAFLVHQLVPGAIAVALVHVWLAVRYRPQACPCLRRPHAVPEIL